MIRSQDYERAVRDKTYRRTPIGQQAARYLRHLRWGDSPDTTIDSYELVYARLALDHDDFADGLSDFCTPVGTEYLREFLERHWSDASPATKRQRTSAIRSLFAWATSEGMIGWNPAAQLKLPRKRGSSERHAFSPDVLYRLVAAQPGLRDQCAIQLLCRLGLRKNELRMLRVGEIDLVRNLITVHGKGGKIAVLPLGPESLRRDLYLHLQAEQRHADEYLLHPRGRRRDPMNPASVHRWFKRCVEHAGFDPQRMMMHEMRHSAADTVRRVRGDVTMAQMLLRHENLATTQSYLHPSRAELAATLEVLDEVWGEG
jgi:site-specific recombinase XerD